MTGEPIPPGLVQALASVRPSTAIVYCSSTTSTNDVAMALARDGATPGGVVIAEAQHAGRGRSGHRWFSPPGAGLYMSAVVAPVLKPSGELSTWMTLAAGVAVAHALREVAVRPVELKWPNDLICRTTDGGWRKLGGILAEAVSAAGAVSAVVVGVGVNLREAAYPPELEALVTSLEREGTHTERDGLAARIVGHLDDIYGRLRAGEEEWVRREWMRLAPLARGALVRWVADGAPKEGRSAGIADDGALLVDADGRRWRIDAGQVDWAPA
ncbi:MAG: biotin--[acetyl-CoA-carboxylase] ligase [Vicinamibacterales bacterium]